MLETGNKGCFLGRFTYEDARKRQGNKGASNRPLFLYRSRPSVSIFVSFERFRRGMKRRALRPSVQLGLSHWPGVGRAGSSRALSIFNASFALLRSQQTLEKRTDEKMRPKTLRESR